jgi:TPP-dependent pyruvate/acetoin dehydrogenase alpha subunit
LRGLEILDDEAAAATEQRVAATIDDAVEYAMQAADPDEADAATDLYA